ncbi:MAG: hypothetical protein PHE88_10625 [Elusimicrobia bacterium]|nr:hypothetical protein [Elusimicrobiota bacterium]
MLCFRRISSILFAIISIIFLCDVCIGAELYDAFLENSLTKVLRDKPYQGKEKSITLYSAKDEYEDGQIIIIPKGKNDLKGIKIQFSDLVGTDTQGKVIKISPANFEYYPVAWAKGRTLTTDLNNNQIQQYLTPRKLTLEDVAAYQPDPFRPDTVFDAHPRQNFVVWLSFYVPKDTAAGTYTGTISVIPQNGKREELKISLTVWDFVLIEKCPLSFLFWSDLNSGARCTGLSQFEYAKYSAKHMLKHHRGNTLLSWSSPSEGSYETFDKQIEEFINLGMDKFWIFVDQRSFYPEGPLRIKNNDERMGPERQAALKRLYNHLKEKKWLDNFMIVTWDEPDFTKEGILEKWQKSQQEIKDVGFTNFECDFAGRAERALDQMIGYAGIWSANLRLFDGGPTDEFIKARKKAGDRIGWYWGSPLLAPAKNFDLTLIEERTIQWLAFKYGIELFGVFNYDLVCRQGEKSPWLNNYESITPQGISKIWKSREEVSIGDSYVYPNPDIDKTRPLLSTIREHVFRDGREDYCYLYMLDQLIKKHKEQGNTQLAAEGQNVLDKSSGMVFKSITEWSVNPSDMFQARKLLAEAILKLSNKK